ncbi:glycosyl transferase, family I [Desulfosarcina variabilis str. Montpellier]|uniref:glycosyltransferase family 4 protein n=1 Tax=Desulfosarcina variabilis TaxID=2300 RepID=UPI003AFA7646
MVFKQPLKILHVLSQRPDSTGSGIYIQAMLNESAKKGYSNFLIAGVEEKRIPRLDCIDGDHCRYLSFGKTDVPFTIVGMSDVMPYESNRFCDLSMDQLAQYEAAFTLHLTETVKQFKPDMIHSHHLWLVTSLTRQLFPTIPLVTTCHGSDLRQFQNCRHLQSRVLKGCRHIDAVMALSKAQKKTIMDLYGLKDERVHVVGAGYHDQHFQWAPKSNPPPVRIVYAGKLSRAKGVPWMLGALSRIDAPDWKLDLVGGGSGAEKAECLELAQGLGDRVTAHGMVPQMRLAKLMQNAHLFVLPSFFEGLPLVVLEALASGCRVITTDLPGVTEILGNHQTDFIELVATPRLIDVDKPVKADEKAFETALQDAIQNQILAAVRDPQIKLSAVADLLDRFSWKGVFARVQAVYHACTRPG